MARPKKKHTERRTEQTKERWTVAEVEHLNQQAALAGITRAEYIRRCALGQRVSAKASAMDPAFILAVNQVGNNVNQLARSVHRGSDFQSYWREVGDQLRSVLHQALDRMDP